MADHPDIERLLARLDLLLKRHEDFSREINDLKLEIFRLKTPSSEIPKTATPGFDQPHNKIIEKREEPKFLNSESSVAAAILPKKKSSDLEKFIGENLINKIGIIITILGVSIGAKYSIENELISPLSRIILGYLFGFVLLGFGIKLKKNYENYSAVLVSGAIAIMYFITYAGFSFYGLFPQPMAFGLMVIFTALSVFTALKYNRPVIALIGMVGAYAIPFLLSTGMGRVEVLFTYMSIINIGILVISLIKYWKSLFYLSFGFTWLIFLAWLNNGYLPTETFTLAFIFSAVFFLIFYLTFLGYKLLHNEKYSTGDVIHLLLNSFIFYGIGYYLLGSNSLEEFQGLFTLLNAVLHAVVSIFIYRQKQADQNLFQLVTGLALVFITIAIPVQLDANWVTLLWAGEAALLFWIGRKGRSPIYEHLSYVVMALAFISILDDWESFYRSYEPAVAQSRIKPLMNIGFLTSVFFILAFGFITWINLKTESASISKSVVGLRSIFSYCISGIFLFSLYYAFRLEIATYWQQLFLDSRVEFMPADQMAMVEVHNSILQAFKSVWIINYTLLFLSALSYLNLRKLKSDELGVVLLVINVFAICWFLTQGLYGLWEIRQSHLTGLMEEYYTTGEFYIWIRYFSIAFAVLILVVTYRFLRAGFMKVNLISAFDIFMHFAILTIASTELFNWVDLYYPGRSFKLGLSILWGIYALLLIVLGIRNNKKHLRLAAIVLFGITLIKLFIYDISHLDTISKTVVFVCLGILLLIISFLYNKYKHRISVEAE